MRVDVTTAVRAAFGAALFGAAGATAYEAQLLLPRYLPRAAVATSFDGTMIARRLARTTLESDERKPIAIGEGTAPVALVLGYTRCADQCPVTLAALSHAVEQTPRSDRIRALFVTTDPEHDTPVVLHRYLAAWHHIVTGASAPMGIVGALQARLGASRGAREGHDTRVFVIDASGDVVAELPPDLSAAELRAALSTVVRAR